MNTGISFNFSCDNCKYTCLMIVHQSGSPDKVSFKCPHCDKLHIYTVSTANSQQGESVDSTQQLKVEIAKVVKQMNFFTDSPGYPAGGWNSAVLRWAEQLSAIE